MSRPYATASRSRAVRGLVAARWYSMNAARVLASALGAKMSVSTSDPSPHWCVIRPRTCSRFSAVATSPPLTQPPYRANLDTASGYVAANRAATAAPSEAPNTSTVSVAADELAASTTAARVCTSRSMDGVRVVGPDNPQPGRS